MSVMGAIGGALISGLLNKRSADKSLNYAEARNEQSDALQKEFAQHGIRWKVEDAKAAGLHPLYALGGSGATYTPSAMSIQTPDYSSVGSGIGDALSQMGQDASGPAKAGMTDDERLLQQLKISEISARVKNDEAQASYWSARAAKEAQDVAGRAAAPRVLGGSAKNQVANMFGSVEPKADAPISRKSGEPSVAAGTHPFFVDYDVGGLNIQVPYSSEGPAEALDNPLLWAPTVGANVARALPSGLWDWIVERRKKMYNSPKRQSFRSGSWR